MEKTKSINSRSIVKTIGHAYVFLFRCRRRLMMYLIRPMFRSYGRNFVFDPGSVFTYETISVGNNVYIGPFAMFIASETVITIGNKVMFGPRVMILAGDHNTSEIGRAMCDVSNKKDGDDLPVVIEDDVWVCAGAIILKGVRLGRGAIVAAGAVVTTNIPPYSVVGGVPARVLKWRWTTDEILAHERILYPIEARLAVERLTQKG